MDLEPEVPSWFKCRYYRHLFPPCNDPAKVVPKVTNPDYIAEHKFLPFIHKTFSVKKRVWASPHGDHPEIKKKNREIFLAPHFDAHVYAYYAWQLRELLEKSHYKKDPDLDASVIGYRHIQVSSEKAGNKNNIHFAKGVFDFISKYDGADTLSAICLDIKSFFDGLDHQLLKNAWAKLVASDTMRLPDDHYKVYKNITRFAYVEVSDLLRWYRENKVPNAPPRAPNLRDLRLLKNGAFFTDFKEFRNCLRTGAFRIRKNNTGKGVPQGSPISAVLSNVYMLDFDKELIQFLKELTGDGHFLYRRYSDDLLLIVPANFKEEVKHHVLHEIRTSARLEIQEEKIQFVEFLRKPDGTWTCVGPENKPWLTYLGLEFDGRDIRLRQATVSRYYKKMKRAIWRGMYLAGKQLEKEGALEGATEREVAAMLEALLFRRRIYKRYTHLGAKAKRIDRKLHVNFLTYAYKAMRVTESEAIRRQMSRHWKICQYAISKIARLHAARLVGGHEKT